MAHLILKKPIQKLLCQISFIVNAAQGTVYIKRQRECWDKTAMMLAIQFSLKTMELLHIGVATDFRATPLFSMRTVSLASLHSCRPKSAIYQHLTLT